MHKGDTVSIPGVVGLIVDDPEEIVSAEFTNALEKLAASINDARQENLVSVDVHQDYEEEIARHEHEDVQRVLATPAARRIAREKDIDLSQVRGTGSRGEITERDIEAFISEG